MSAYGLLGSRLWATYGVTYLYADAKHPRRDPLHGDGVVDRHARARGRRRRRTPARPPAHLAAWRQREVPPRARLGEGRQALRRDDPPASRVLRRTARRV